MNRWIVALAAGLAIIVAALALAWTPDRPADLLRARWAPAPSKFVKIAGMDIHLRDEGRRNAPPLVLIHGTASSLHTWEPWAAALNGRYRVVSFDLPGSGLSDAFPDDDYRVENYVRFVTALLDHLEIGRATLIGSSKGGRIAWATAAAAPDRVERLVLIDARGYPAKGDESSLLLSLARIPVLRSAIERITPRSFIEKGLMEAYGDPARVTPELVDRYYELHLHPGNRRALFLQTEQESYADWKRIGSVAVPTLIMWGRLDRRVPVEDAERFHRDIAGSRLLVFDRLGHLPHEEDPGGTMSALRDFLAP